MATQQPSSTSPTSLLWAHKLQLEHGYLLKRMQNLEAKSEAQASRLAEAESLAQTAAGAGVADLAAKVKAVDDAGVVRRLGGMEREIGQKLDDTKTATEAVKVQLGAVQDEQVRTKEEQDAAIGRERELLKRISEVEDGLKKFERSLEQLGKRLDEARFEQIRGRLVGLAEEARVQGERMKFLPESIKALEKSNAELKKAVGRNEDELRKMSAKANGNAGSQQHNSPPGDETEPPPRKKSHKWSGGGADRDIIRHGSDLFGSSITSTASPQMPRKKKRSHSPGPRHWDASTADSGTPPQKSNRWSGGETDRDVMQPGQAQAQESEDRPSLMDSSMDSDVAAQQNLGHAEAPSKIGSMAPPSTRPELDTTKPATVLVTGPNEVVTRTGKGWYEVAFAETRAPAVKRKRGRPRKAHITPQWTEEGLLVGRSTRRMNYSPQDRSTTRKRDSRTAFPSQLEGGPAIKKEQADDSEDSILVRNSLPESNGEQSPAVESQATTEVLVTGQGQFDVPVESAGTTQLDEAGSSSPVPQRYIIQDEDYETFMARDE